MSEQESYQQRLRQIYTSAGAVRELIEEVEALRAKVKQYEEAEKQEPEWYLVEDDSQDEIQFLTKYERVDAEYWAKRDGVTLTPLYTRPAPMPEGCVLGAKRYQWIRDNIKEELTPNSLKGDLLYEHKTQFVLPTLIAWADFCGQLTFDEAVDIAMLTAAEEGK